MKFDLSIITKSKTEFIDITEQVGNAVKSAGLTQGLCCIYIPHTTAGVTINEGADPAVKRDIISMLNKLIPLEGDYHHSEGNSAAHIKTTMTGNAAVCPIENGRLLLGTWQSVFLCEFDGPRTRRVYICIS